jgi:hypothetical protein
MQQNVARFSAPDIEVDGGYISPFFATETADDGDKVAVLLEPLIAIHAQALSNGSEIARLAEHAVQSRKALLLIGAGIEGDALESLVVNVDRGGYPFAAVKISGCIPGCRLKMDDIATVTGGLVLDESLGVRIDSLTTQQMNSVLGSARMVRIEESNTVIFGGGGRPLTAKPDAQTGIDGGSLAEVISIHAEEPLPAKPKRGGGRPPKYPWPLVLAELRRRLVEDGFPAAGDGGQAVLERFVASKFPVDSCPAVSTIREKVRKEIEAFRHDLGNEGRKGR